MIPISSNEVLKMRTAKVFRCFPAFVSNGSFFQRSDRGRHRIGRPRADDLKVAVVGCMVPSPPLWAQHSSAIPDFWVCYKLWRTVYVYQTALVHLGSTNVTPEAWEIKYPVFWAVKSMWGPRWIAKLVNETLLYHCRVYDISNYLDGVWWGYKRL